MRRLIVSLMVSLLCVASAAAEIPVGDPSFENQSMSGGIYNYIEPPWYSSVTGPWASYEGQYGVTNVPDGTQYATPSDDDLYQDLTATYAAGKTYLLTALASSRGTNAGGADDAWQIALHDTAGNELAATTGEFDLTAGTWDEISVEYTATATDAGKAIRIYFSTGSGINSGNWRFVLDDVHLTSTTIAGVLISQSDGETFASEAGITDSYTVALQTEPTDSITITATPGDGEIDIGNAPGGAVTLTFTTSDWNTTQTVTVAAFDDTVYEGGPNGSPHITTISHSAQQSGGSGEYDGISIASVDVSVFDDELICGDWGYDPADFNQDCYVNLFDYAEFALHYLDGF